MNKIDSLDQLWSHVTKTESGCWEYDLQHTPPNTYGVVYFRGKTYGAHWVVMYLLHDIWSTRAIVIRHSCDNKRCINPHHL